MKQEELSAKIDLLKADILKQQDKMYTFILESRLELQRLNTLTLELETLSKSIAQESNSKSDKNNVSEHLSKILEIKEYQIGSYTLNTKAGILTHDNRIIRLARKEVYLLAVFATNINVLVEREAILETIWKEVSYLKTRSMDVYITKLKKYLKHDPEIHLVNKHKKGYILIIQKEA